MKTRKSIKLLFEFIFVYLTGGLIYGAMETLCRGFTHWTMLLTGGACFSLLYLISIKSKELLWKQCLMGAFIITAIEFVVGGIVNIHLNWNVWDYSKYSFNLMGQICFYFSFLWFILCFPGIFLSRALNKMLAKIGKKTELD